MRVSVSSVCMLVFVGTCKCISFETELQPDDEPEPTVQGEYDWKKLDEVVPNNDKQLFLEANEWFILNRLGLLRKLSHQGDVQGRFRYARDVDGVWYRFIHPPIDFEHYLETLPRLTRRCDNDRLQKSEDGKFWMVKRAYDNKITKLVVKGSKQSRQSGNIMRNARDELGSWYTFVNPPQEVLNYIDELPVSSMEVSHSDNFRLFPISDGEEWRVKDDTGVYRKVEIKGDSFYNNKGMYYIRADDKKWYKFKRPPERFIEYLKSFPEQKHSNVKKQLSNVKIHDGKITHAFPDQERKNSFHN